MVFVTDICWHHQRFAPKVLDHRLSLFERFPQTRGKHEVGSFSGISQSYRSSDSVSTSCDDCYLAEKFHKVLRCKDCRLHAAEETTGPIRCKVVALFRSPLA